MLNMMITFELPRNERLRKRPGLPQRVIPKCSVEWQVMLQNYTIPSILVRMPWELQYITPHTWDDSQRPWHI